MKNLAHCYQGIYKDRCGEDAADVMMTLVNRALEDPYYLRYYYTPDCNYLRRVIHGNSSHLALAGKQERETVVSDIYSIALDEELQEEYSDASDDTNLKPPIVRQNGGNDDGDDWTEVTSSSASTMPILLMTTYLLTAVIYCTQSFST